MARETCTAILHRQEWEEFLTVTILQVLSLDLYAANKIQFRVYDAELIEQLSPHIKLDMANLIIKTFVDGILWDNIVHMGSIKIVCADKLTGWFPLVKLMSWMW